MTAGYTPIAEKNFQTFLFVVLAGIHQTNDRCQHGIGAQKSPMAADAGRSAAKTVDTTRCFDILFEAFRRYVMRILFARRFRIDDIWLYTIDLLIGFFNINDQVTNHRSDFYGIDRKSLELRFQPTVRKPAAAVR